jgi:hypothetical protein
MSGQARRAVERLFRNLNCCLTYFLNPHTTFQSRSEVPPLDLPSPLDSSRHGPQAVIRPKLCSHAKPHRRGPIGTSASHADPAALQAHIHRRLAGRSARPRQIAHQPRNSFAQRARPTRACHPIHRPLVGGMTTYMVAFVRGPNSSWAVRMSPWLADVRASLDRRHPRLCCVRIAGRHDGHPCRSTVSTGRRLSSASCRVGCAM